ncbi:14776_t:CDS:2 [Funneliformis geosporum]|nr:14776_t:CDS:2 [Funneliformis geosporum]
MSEELVNIFNILLGISMVIGPVLGYFDQIKKFRETKSSSGYSLDTTGILLVSSIIRVYFCASDLDIQLYQLQTDDGFGIVGMLGILQLIFYEQEWFTETLGYLSLGIESTVPMPQAYQNFKRHSVSGFSKWIILTWVGGDSFKTFYYIYTNAPLQFILCGIVQLSVDFVVVFQTVIYGRKMREIFGLNDTRWYNNRPSSYSSLDNI